MILVGKWKLGLLSAVMATGGLACGDDGGSAAPDAAVDVETCTTLLVRDQTFSLPQEAGDRSFQTHAHFDGEAIWIAHAFAPLGGSSIVIQALRVRCDGSVVNAPVVISPDNSFTHTEPRITGYGDKVMVAWQTDNQGNPNLSTHYRVFDKTVGPASEATVHMDTQYMGASAGNTWFPALSASASGFAVAGLRGVSDFLSFQSFVQRVDFDGAMVGNAVNGKLQDDLSQGEVALSLDDQGNLSFAWERTEMNDDKYVVYSRIASGQDAPEGEPIRASNKLGSQPAFGSSADRQYLVLGLDEGGLIFKPHNNFLDPDSAAIAMGNAGTPALYPQLAASSDGGALAWLEGTTGANAEIHMQAFTDSGSVLSRAGEERTIATDNPSIAPYRLSLVYLADHVFLLTWTEGPASDLQVKWRFVDMSL